MDTPIFVRWRKIYTHFTWSKTNRIEVAFSPWGTYYSITRPNSTKL